MPGYRARRYATLGDRSLKRRNGHASGELDHAATDYLSRACGRVWGRQAMSRYPLQVFRAAGAAALLTSAALDQRPSEARGLVTTTSSNGDLVARSADGHPHWVVRTSDQVNTGWQDHPKESIAPGNGILVGPQGQVRARIHGEQRSRVLDARTAGPSCRFMPAASIQPRLSYRCPV